jgi:hypothetical protein
VQPGTQAGPGDLPGRQPIAGAPEPGRSLRVVSRCPRAGSRCL